MGLNTDRTRYAVKMQRTAEIEKDGRTGIDSKLDNNLIK